MLAPGNAGLSSIAVGRRSHMLRLMVVIALNADLAMFVDRVRIIQHKRVDAVSYG